MLKSVGFIIILIEYDQWSMNWSKSVGLEIIRWRTEAVCWAWSRWFLQTLLTALEQSSAAEKSIAAWIIDAQSVYEGQTRLLTSWCADYTPLSDILGFADQNKQKLLCISKKPNACTRRVRWRPFLKQCSSISRWCINITDLGPWNLILDIRLMEMTRICGVWSWELSMAWGLDLDPPTTFRGQKMNDGCDYFTQTHLIHTWPPLIQLGRLFLRTKMMFSP